MSERQPIQVMVVDDHGVVRSGLRFFLLGFEDMVLVGEAANGQEALQLCAENPPDIILMDMVMPGMDGVTTTQLIRDRHPQVQVIALTSFPDEDLVQRALQAGAISYLLKNVPAEELAEAIRAAAAGHSTLAPEATQALINAANRPVRWGQNLTHREQEVLALLTKGLNNNQIAEKLVISRATARFHVSNILAKLGANNRAEAVAIAVKHKLVD
jgi:NarL family two-component system response regulator LiaR